MKILLLAVLFLSACDHPTQKDYDAMDGEAVVRSLMYVKDPKTGNCFAYLHYQLSYYHDSLTWVPCP
jgi:hypothetical protein